jgi:hypothetical protein
LLTATCRTASFVSREEDMPMSTVNGTCLCTSVCFEATLPPITFRYCHCASCRKATSSAHAANLFFALDRFRWITGESLVERFVDQAVNPGYMRWFCRKCGSAVPRLSRSGQYYQVPAGLLDDDPLAKPERSIYWDDRAPWLINIDAIPKLSEGVDSIMRAQARNDFPGTYPLGI